MIKILRADKNVAVFLEGFYFVQNIVLVNNLLIILHKICTQSTQFCTLNTFNVFKHVQMINIHSVNQTLSSFAIILN